MADRLGRHVAMRFSGSTVWEIVNDALDAFRQRERAEVQQQSERTAPETQVGEQLPRITGPSAFVAFNSTTTLFSMMKSAS